MSLKNSALGHLTLPATSASFGAFLPPGPEVPSRKVAAGGLSALGGGNAPRWSNHIQERQCSVGPPAHKPDQRVPSSPKAHSVIRSEASTARQQNLPRASRRTACHRSLANHQIPFGYVGRVNFSTTIRFTVVFAYLSGSMLRCKTARCLGVAWGGLATWCSSRIDSRICAPIRQQDRTALRQHDQTQGALSC